VIVVWYYNPSDKTNVSIYPREISIQKYKAMLIATIKNELEVLGYANSEGIQSEILARPMKTKRSKIAILLVGGTRIEMRLLSTFS
jgi:hypothetical protein